MLRDHDFTDYRNRRVTVMGLGSFGGGAGAVRFLAERGAIVTVTDARPAEQLAESIAELNGVPVANWTLGGHDEADFTNPELVVVNPAIKRDHPLLQRCRDRGVPLTSEMNLFWQHNPAPVIGVTGSNGKSTTTALLANIIANLVPSPLSDASRVRVREPNSSDGRSHPNPPPHQNGGEGTRKCWLGGNLGRSLLPRVAEIRSHDRVVLELSSFQLADLDRLQVSPHIAVVTNFAPNHLDWHGTLDEYRRAKQTILRWQTANDLYVVNAEDAEVATWTGPGRRFTFGALRSEDSTSRLTDVQRWLRLPGRHNLMNALAATTAALAAGANWDAIQRGLETYEPLPHRLQFVGQKAGRRFYNDSLATTPESVLVALDAFTEPIVLLAGGYDKRITLSEMASAIAGKTKAVALMGQTAPVLHQLIAAHPQRHTIASDPLPDFRSAFDWAVGHSAPGDVVLLSPGCASYDWFRNFADRGEQFVQLVNAWSADRSAASPLT